MEHLSRSRENMVVNQLLTNKVLEGEVLSAMAGVPREWFVGEVFRGAAYVDEEIAIAPDRYLMEPLTLARMLQYAKLSADDTVLDIGCGTGYSTAVISRLVKYVTAVEERPELADKARHTLKRLDTRNVEVHTAPLSAGYALGAPYSVIIINGAVKQVPDALSSQLKQGGRMVYAENIAVRPGAPRGLSKVILSEKSGSYLSRKICFDAFLPVLPGFDVTDKFVL